MKPILFSGTETAFTSQGLGTFEEAVSCIVTEERNGEYELKLRYPVTGHMYERLALYQYVLAKPNDTSDPQPFRIYRIDTPMSGIVDIYAEHISYLLSGIPVNPFSAAGVSLALTGLVSNSAITHNFTTWTDISNGTSTFTLDHPQSFRACLGGVEGSVLDVYGGEYEFDKWTVKLHAKRGSDSGVTIEYGKNLTDLEQEQNIEKVYTGVIAYWQDRDDDTNVITSEIQYVDNYANYPQQRILIYDATSDYKEQPTVDDLNTRAAKYRDDNDVGTPKVNLTVSFVALWQTKEFESVAPLERVNLCDTVTINFPKLGVSAKSKVIKTEYDTLAERYKEIELGDAKSSFSSTIVKAVTSDINSAVGTSEKRTASAIETAISEATDKITGGTGGHFVIGTNADGQPNETYWMDTDDQSTAVKVLRANYEGIGGSSDGIDGPYNVAITTDGQINADAITTGTLNANLITAGTITDATGNNYWNLDTGEVQFGAVATTDDMDHAMSDLQQQVQDTHDAITDETTTAITDALGDYVTTSDHEAAVSDLTGQIYSVNSNLTEQISDTSDKVDSVSDDLQTKYGTITQYMRFGSDGLTLGKTNSTLTLQLTNDRISFQNGGAEIAYVTGKKLYITDATFLSSVQIGKFAFIPRENGNMSLIRITSEA